MCENARNIGMCEKPGIIQTYARHLREEGVAGRMKNTDIVQIYFSTRIIISNLHQGEAYV